VYSIDPVELIRKELSSVNTSNSFISFWTHRGMLDVGNINTPQSHCFDFTSYKNQLITPHTQRKYNDNSSETKFPSLLPRSSNPHIIGRSIN